MRQTPSTDEILSIEGDRVAVFIRKHADARTLSTMVKRLNAELLAGDRMASEMAAKALHHLGFVEHA